MGGNRRIKLTVDIDVEVEQKGGRVEEHRPGRHLDDEACLPED